MACTINSWFSICHLHATASRVYSYVQFNATAKTCKRIIAPWCWKGGGNWEYGAEDQIVKCARNSKLFIATRIGCLTVHSVMSALTFLDNLAFAHRITPKSPQTLARKLQSNHPLSLARFALVTATYINTHTEHRQLISWLAPFPRSLPTHPHPHFWRVTHCVYVMFCFGCILP